MIEDKSNRCSFCGYKTCQCAEIANGVLEKYIEEHPDLSVDELMTINGVALWLDKEDN